MKTRIVGYLSLAFGLLILFSEILMFLLFVRSSGNPITTNLMVVAFLYAAYKTLHKKEELSRSEWIAMAFLFIIFLLPLFFVFS